MRSPGVGVSSGIRGARQCVRSLAMQEAAPGRPVLQNILVDKFVSRASPPTDSFDYIVVGAGAAGCVVARRLSDQPDCRVLLLEAGPPADDFWIRTPAGMAKLFKSERYNWRYYTEPVPTLRNRRLYWPSGKTLGGSSAINGMVHYRGNRDDYDHWARLGNSGWSWDEVLPYFKRSESNVRGVGPYHGGDGPLFVGDPSVVHPSVVDFVEAARRTGLPRIDDFTGVEKEGAGFTQVNIRDGIRQSAYDAFVAPERSRTNLSSAPGFMSAG